METMADTHRRARVLLKRYTTFRIGGRPALYLRPRSRPELGVALRQCRRREMPFRVMGGGSNILVDDGQLPFAVIHICAPGFDWIERRGDTTLRVGAGVRLSRLLAYCRRAGLGGLEFLAAIPGTFGGALAGNAGAWGQAIAERLTGVWLVDHAGKAGYRPADQVRFGYRSCGLGACIVTDGDLELEPRSPREIKSALARYTSQKSRRHPMGSASAGCVFKNPPHAAAGKLIDDCGLKGRRVGGAQVSTRHANFICNVGGATAHDVAELIGTVREAVSERFNVALELEIKHWESKAA